MHACMYTSMYTYTHTYARTYMQNKNKINKTQVVSYYVEDMPDEAF